MKRIEMNFLPDVYVMCDVCRGARYNRETLAVKFKGCSIADLLGRTVEETLPLLENVPQIKVKLQTLIDVGLGYIKLGQSATTLSGGEAQRIKLAKELSKRATGRTRIYLTSRRQVCTSTTCGNCWTFFTSLYLLGTPYWSWSTTST